MKSIARKLTLLGTTVLAMLVTGCATQTHPSDRLLWEGIDETSTNAAPSTPQPK